MKKMEAIDLIHEGFTEKFEQKTKLFESYVKKAEEIIEFNPINLQHKEGNKDDPMCFYCDFLKSIDKALLSELDQYKDEYYYFFRSYAKWIITGLRAYLRVLNICKIYDKFPPI